MSTSTGGNDGILMYTANSGRKPTIHNLGLFLTNMDKTQQQILQISRTLEAKEKECRIVHAKLYEALNMNRAWQYRCHELELKNATLETQLEQIDVKGIINE